MIHFIIKKAKKEASREAANLVRRAIEENSSATLGLATGSSPLDLYADLVKECEIGQLSFSRVVTVNLDEYVGLSPDHDQSYAYFMRENLFRHIDIRQGNTYLPNGMAEDLAQECERYHHLLKWIGERDLQVLGIGNNGHIGFNEPSDSFQENTSVVALTESTIEANSRFFAKPEDVPRRAISMGIGEILNSKKILLLAFGIAKAEILEKALFGDVTPAVPASALQNHNEVYVFADKDAAKVILEKHSEIKMS